MEFKTLFQKIVQTPNVVKGENNAFLLLAMAEEVGHLSKTIGMNNASGSDPDTKKALKRLLRYTFILCHEKQIDVEELLTTMTNEDI